MFLNSIIFYIFLYIFLAEYTIQKKIYDCNFNNLKLNFQPNAVLFAKELKVFFKVRSIYFN